MGPQITVLQNHQQLTCSDHSFQHRDSEAYYLRSGDSWTNIDYSKDAKSWMVPVQRGTPTGLVEIAVNWDVS